MYPEEQTCIIIKKHYGRDYYRRNKLQGFRIHKCPHCTYETTGPKSALKAHIYACMITNHRCKISASLPVGQHGGRFRYWQTEAASKIDFQNF